MSGSVVIFLLKVNSYFGIFDGMQKWRSTITTVLLRKTLWRGSLIAIFGGLLLLYAGTTWSTLTLQVWGLPTLLVGIGAIAVGLVPYRRLSRLAMKPSELILEEEVFTLISRSKIVFSISKESVNRIKFKATPEQYGMEFQLADGKKLALPYFSERTCREILSIFYFTTERTESTERG